VMLCSVTDVMLCGVTDVMLCGVADVMLCSVTDVMLCSVTDSHQFQGNLHSSSSGCISGAGSSRVKKGQALPLQALTGLEGG
jgi:hypothetical protein